MDGKLAGLQAAILRQHLPAELSGFVLRDRAGAMAILDGTVECLALAKVLRDDAEAKFVAAVERLGEKIVCADGYRLAQVLIEIDAPEQDAQDYLAACVPAAVLTRRIGLLEAGIARCGHGA